MRIVELILDEAQSMMGIEAISIVENPAIEENFLALKSDEIKLAEVNKEKKILMGALLIPNKPIYRKAGKDEYYIYFSKDTVEKASQLYLKNGKQNNSTLEHKHELSGLTLVESWIVEDTKFDKSRKYGLDVPVGTWMGAVKVNNDDVWNEYVKTGKVKGFSIEGYFADKMERPKDNTTGLSEQEADLLLSQITSIVKGEKVELKSSVAVLEEYTYELNKSTEDLMILATEAKETISQGVKELTRVDAVNKIAKKRLENISEAAKDLGVKIPQITELQKAINGYEQQRKSLTKVLK
tara:strand:+ start:77 stop:964 length:888 start_codon:yes stop_codon:yes gene_type:complete